VECWLPSWQTWSAQPCPATPLFLASNLSKEKDACLCNAHTGSALHAIAGALSKAFSVLTTGRLESEQDRPGDRDAGDLSAAEVQAAMLGAGGSGGGLDGPSPALRAVAAKVVALEQVVDSLSRAPSVRQAASNVPAGGASGTGESGSSDAAQQQAEALATLESKLGEYGKVLQAMKNRTIALQVRCIAEMLTLYVGFTASRSEHYSRIGGIAYG
jgi:hypothetical protein